MQDLTSTTWGRFQIVEERGRGGMAAVFEAYDDILQRTVALKVLLPVLAANAEFTQRFRHEAITAANLKHPNIVVIYDVGSHNNFQYIVMEFLEGPTLQHEIQTRGALPCARVITILRQLADALDYAHQQGLIHRDVKPANVMIGSDDHVTLTDFGLVKAARSSKITSEGGAVGTLAYMSPEQAAGKELDARSDVYSLGIVTYEMLAGRVPFHGTTPYETLRDLMSTPPPPLTLGNAQVPSAVERVVLHALAKDAGQRYATAGAFAQALADASGVAPARRSEQDTNALERQVALLLVGSDGRQFPVYVGRVTIGREASNDIVLANQQVSRQHARLRCKAGECTITDLGSTNGTSINGTAIPARETRPLRAGDVLGLGPVMLLVTLPSSRGESSTASMEIK